MKTGIAMRSLFGMLLLALTSSLPVVAQETVCARVKIEVRQELTLERQAFDAEMRLTNTLPDMALTEVRVDVKITDEVGVPVRVSSDPNDVTAQFFIRVSNKANLGGDIDGSGVVSANSTAEVNWLIIPAPGSAGTTPLGKKYLVGATLRYKFGAEIHTLDVSPDVITVRPLPRLTLDYFLPQDVLADDPLTAEVEAVVPFTLGVRVKNSGMAPAKSLKIDSAQPRIVENIQGLLINFALTGSFVNDAPVAPTLKLDFGQLDGGTTKMGRWIMETTLAGRFTEFNARYTHADELGGQLTSLIEAVNTHFLVRDVRVDLPGRDLVRDFLGETAGLLRVFESDGTDTAVLNLSAQAVLTPGAGATYRLQVPPTIGFVYARVRDPFNGTRALAPVVRDDAKPIGVENMWLSKTRNPQTRQYEYWVHLFDVNTPGGYSTEFRTPTATRRPPVIQLVSDRTVRELQQVSFVVEASSPDNRAVTLSAAPLPLGATFVRDGSSTQTLARWFFDWTPARGQTGRFPVTFTASDGELSASRAATITVNAETPPGSPQLPLIEAPAVGVMIRLLQPDLVAAVPTSDDPATSFTFEVYADAGYTSLVQTGSAVARSGDRGTWKVPTALNDNSDYYWRVRTSGAGTSSPWANGRFRVNLANDAPRAFQVSSPTHNGEALSLSPTLTIVNAFDPDGDPLKYRFQLFADNALTQLLAESALIDAFSTGSTSWRVPVPLQSATRYWWRAFAFDPEQAEGQSPIVSFTVNTGNRPPSTPGIVGPAMSTLVPATTVSLTAGGSGDPDGDAISYQFEIDTTPTFTGSVTASPLLPSTGANVGWPVVNLLENTRYYWRVRTVDARSAASAWAVSDFFVNAVNEAPATPALLNPGNGATISTTEPRLQVGPAIDPDGDTVTYEFELYAGSSPTSLLLGSTSNTTEVQVPAGVLADGRTYNWRTRTRDAGGLTSAWSLSAVFQVRPLPRRPGITLTSPTAPTEVTSGSFTLTYDAVDPQNDALIALYYAPSPTATGTLIIDGLRLNPNSSSGSHVWNLSGLTPGTYYVYGVISNAVGSSTHYAPGAVIIPVPPSNAGFTVQAPAPLVTTEQGGTGTFTVVLNTAPTADVAISLTSTNVQEGTVAPALLTFTPANWNVPQTVTVRGVDDCVRDNDRNYTITLGRAVSLDAAYNNLKPDDVAAVNRDDDTSTVCPAPHDGNSFRPISLLQGLEMRAGLSIIGTWELAVGHTIGVSPRFASAPHNWQSGATYNWTLDIDGGNGVLRLYSGASLVRTVTYSGSTGGAMQTGNAVRIGVLGAGLAMQGSRVRATVTSINGHPVTGAITTNGRNGVSEESVYFASPLLQTRMNLQGTVTYTFGGGQPPRLGLLHLFVRMGNVTQ